MSEPPWETLPLHEIVNFVKSLNAKWYGIRTSSPSGLSLGDAGAWWYRSDLKLFAYWDGVQAHNPKRSHGFVKIAVGATSAWFPHNLYTDAGPFRNPLLTPWAANTFGAVTLTPLQDCGGKRWWVFGDPVMVPEMLCAFIDSPSGVDLWFSWTAEVDVANI